VPPERVSVGRLVLNGKTVGLALRQTTPCASLTYSAPDVKPSDPTSPIADPSGIANV
jgi:hypothetical protein